jgi:hypothetical protein
MLTIDPWKAKNGGQLTALLFFKKNFKLFNTL